MAFNNFRKKKVPQSSLGEMGFGSQAGTILSPYDTYLESLAVPPEA